MKVRRGRTALLLCSLRQITEESGQIASTIWVDESVQGCIKHWIRVSRGKYCDLPTRLSTKLILRSDCRTSAGGAADRACDPAVRRGFWRSSAGTEVSASRCRSERRKLAAFSEAVTVARFERQ